MTTRRPYANIWDWMDRTGINVTTLAKLAGIERPFLSHILRRSRRCSLANALKLMEVTGVPVEKLFAGNDCVPKSRSTRAA